MNFDKSPETARRIAKEQKKLRQKAKNGQLAGKDRAKLEWDVTFENYDEVYEEERHVRSHQGSKTGPSYD